MQTRDPVYELGDNKVVYGLEVRDDLSSISLRYGTYGKEDTNVLIYDTISKKIVFKRDEHRFLEHPKGS